MRLHIDGNPKYDVIIPYIFKNSKSFLRIELAAIPSFGFHSSLFSGRSNHFIQISPLFSIQIYFRIRRNHLIQLIVPYPNHYSTISSVSVKTQFSDYKGRAGISIKDAGAAACLFSFIISLRYPYKDVQWHILRYFYEITGSHFIKVFAFLTNPSPETPVTTRLRRRD